MKSMKYLKSTWGIFLGALLVYIAIFFSIRSIYRAQLSSKIKTLIMSNQSMMHYQGMTYDMTGLGPFIVFNIERENDFELAYLKLISGNNVYERTFRDWSNIHPNTIIINKESSDIAFSAVAKMTTNSLLWINLFSFAILLSIAVISYAVTLWLNLKKNYEVSNLAKQVAHDIRSPLEVLKSLKNEMDDLPENSKRRLQMSLGRIEEIAYNLLREERKTFLSNRKNDIGSLLDVLNVILLEKKLEYRLLDSIIIRDNFNKKSYGLFSKIDQGVLKRVVSNLINNAVEALPDKNGIVEVSLFNDQEINIIQIRDNGTGIPEEVRGQLFTEGFSTKKKGFGLGLYGALKEISSIGGSIDIDGQVNKGTVVRVKLPRIDAPKEFIKSIDAYKYKKIIVVDDDHEIHELWRNRLSKFTGEIECFLSFDMIMNKYPFLSTETLLLSDYEVTGSSLNGVDFIVRMKNVQNSILITARSDEKDIRDKCFKEGIGMLSKNSMSYVSVQSCCSMVVLIDDDKLIRINWKNYFDDKGIPFESFSSIDQFLKDSTRFDKKSFIYIDSNLEQGIKGEVESERIYKLGFSNLFL